MVGGHLIGEPQLQVSQRKDRFLGRVGSLLAQNFIEGVSGYEAHAPHERTQESFYRSAIPRRAYRPIAIIDVLPLTSQAKGQ